MFRPFLGIFFSFINLHKCAFNAKSYWVSTFLSNAFNLVFNPFSFSICWRPQELILSNVAEETATRVGQSSCVSIRLQNIKIQVTPSKSLVVCPSVRSSHESKGVSKTTKSLWGCQKPQMVPSRLATASPKGKGTSDCVDTSAHTHTHANTHVRRHTLTHTVCAHNQSRVKLPWASSRLKSLFCCHPNQT